MSLPKIKSVEIGWGSNSTHYEVNSNNRNPITKIEQATKPIGSQEIVVYRGYKGKILDFEIEAGSGVVLRFFHPENETDEI